ncbi:hypothetical protein FOZ63_029335, partial [Perkinsus olseni]
LCRTQKNLKTSILGHWRRQYQMVCEERELLVVNLKKKCLLLWYFATKSAVEQSEMVKPLDAALIEKIDFSTGIEALNRHACMMHQRMALRRIRHEIAAGSDRQ